MGTTAPLLLLDVDGVLSPFAAKAGSVPAGYVEHQWRLSWWSRRNPLRMWLNPEHGVELNRLGAQLVWATSWEHKANTMIGPAIGLPNLPVITFCESSSWKYTAVDRYAAGRPLAWLDDDFDLYPTARDAFLERRGDAATELVRVNPRTGITREHLTAVEKWIDSL